jgi:hypothetical protein
VRGAKVRAEKIPYRLHGITSIGRDRIDSVELSLHTLTIVLIAHSVMFSAVCFVSRISSVL